MTHPAPPSTLPVGLVGLNFGATIAAEMRTNPRMAGYRLAMVCDLDEAKARAFGAEHGVPYTSDLDTLLADPAIPAVILMTGPQGRATLIDRIISAGKDVITTKPFETSADAAERVLRKAAELGRGVFINSPSTGKSPELDQIRAWEKDFQLGRLVGARWEGGYKAVEKADGSWYDDPEQCPAAPLFRLGIYGVNELVQLFGEPDSLQVQESRFLTGRPTSDLAQMQIRFKNGGLVSLMAGWCFEPRHGVMHLKLFYEQGCITRHMDLVKSNHHVVMNLYLPEEGFSRAAQTLELDLQALGYGYPWEAFYEAVTTGQGLVKPENHRHMVQAIRLMEGMKASSMTHKPYTFP